MNWKMISCVIISCLAIAGLGASTTAPASPAETATTFLKDLERGDTNAAMKLWSGGANNARVRDRVAGVASKIKKLGGIKKIRTPNVEKRPKNLASHEVVAIVLYGNDKDLAIGSFSFVNTDGEYRISNLRSEQGYGGTTSLFESDESDESTTDQSGS